MLALVPEGFEESTAADAVELAAYTDADGEARLEEAFGAIDPAPVPGGWEDAWKRFHRPVRVGPLWVGPPWEHPEPGALAVVIDPGRAFGTGAHASTRLCLELIAATERGSLVDLGCGSGVLSIAAAKLGFAPVTALDSDADAVAASRANAAANGVAIEAMEADVLVNPLPVADVAVANIELGAVEAVAPRVRADRLVTAGYLVRDRPAVPGRTHVERRARDGWAADLFATA